MPGRNKIQGGIELGNRTLIFLFLETGFIGLKPQHFLAIINDRELIDQPFELGNEMSRNETVRSPGAASWYAPITASMNSRRTIGSSPEVGSSSTSNSGSAQTAPISANWVLWPLEGRWSFWWGPNGIVQQFLFGAAVPLFTKGGEVVQRGANGHPRIEGHVVRHVGQPGLDRHFVPPRIIRTPGHCQPSAGANSRDT